MRVQFSEFEITIIHVLRPVKDGMVNLFPRMRLLSTRCAPNAPQREVEVRSAALPAAARCDMSALR